MKSSSDAAAPCTLLPWDTQFFGFPIGRVTAERVDAAAGARVLAWCDENAVRCLYFLCDPNDDDSVSFAEQSAFHMVDIRITMTARFHDRPRATTEVKEGAQRGSAIDPQLVVRKARAEDGSDLVGIAEANYETTRFSWDKHFDRDKARELYRVWIERSVNGWADRTLVVERAGVALGFVTLHLDGPRARIGLVGIDKDAQGRGVGGALIAAALDDVRAHGNDEIEVTTQGRNVAAQALYQGAGFRASDLRVWYHRWFAR